jgi:hypothetical protein
MRSCAVVVSHTESQRLVKQDSGFAPWRSSPYFAGSAASADRMQGVAVIPQNLTSLTSILRSYVRVGLSLRRIVQNIEDEVTRWQNRV